MNVKTRQLPPLKKGGWGGFTLLEILIALAILAILMTGLLKIASDNTRNLWHIENKTLAAIIAANHATQLRLGKEKPEQDDGWETQADRRWYWQAKRQVTTTLGLWRYRVSVYLEGDKEPYTELTSFIPEPFIDVEKNTETPIVQPVSDQ
jgi:general secretion pathway protein I